uniref:LOB domain-containing protein n=1 Tax=Araucaria cunninghamii TaxID=56994 RepID=A0A0D6RB68_ARACU
MRMSCNGCRVLRKGCSDACILRPCLQWIKSAESQANATVFLAKFYGRTGLMNLISNGPQHSRPALFRSLLYEACGRILNPIYGSVGLLWSGNWAVCQAGVESILQGSYPLPPPRANTNTDTNSPGLVIGNNSTPASVIAPLQEHCDPHHELHIVHGTLMQSIANELHKVKARGKFKCVSPQRKPKSIRERALIGTVQISSDSSSESDAWAADTRNISPENYAKRDDENVFDKSESSLKSQHPQDLAAIHALNPKVEALYLHNSEVEEVELELTLGAQGSSSPQHLPHRN